MIETLKCFRDKLTTSDIMTEAVDDDAFTAMSQIKENRSGTLKLQNGSLAVDVGGNVYLTTIVTTTPTGDEAVAEGTDQLRRAASPHSTATGQLSVQSGNLYLTNDTQQVTLVD